MTDEFGYLLGFLTGVLGAGHCLGMCGGLAAGAALHRDGGRPAALLAYHGMRIAAYGVLGALGAALGRVLVQSGALGKFQGQLLILTGLVIVAVGLAYAGLLPGVAARCPRAAPRLAPPLAGLVNGLVPCSLVFSVAVRATATADPWQAGLLMLAFGLGTLPLMAGVSALGGLTARHAHGSARRLAGGAVVLFGAWTVYEGAVFYQVMSGLAD